MTPPGDPGDEKRPTPSDPWEAYLDGLADDLIALEEVDPRDTFMAGYHYHDLAVEGELLQARYHLDRARALMVGLDPAVVEEARDFEVGQRVRHRESGWSGRVVDVGERGVTVRPTHPRPKEVLRAGTFVATPADWPGWSPLTVQSDELERC